MTAPHPDTSLRDRTLGELAATLPGAIGIFRRSDLDFSRDGDIALGEAIRRGDIGEAELERELCVLVPSGAVPAQDWPTGKLIDHILTRYHETHRRELPVLIELARTVERVHADRPQVPHGLAALLQRMRGELEVHMKKEELILYPAMRHRAGGGLDAPIAQMRHDHAEQGEYLRQIEDITGGFALPEDACRSWQALYSGTAKLEEDLIQHLHLENNVLFPRYQGPSVA